MQYLLLGIGLLIGLLLLVRAFVSTDPRTLARGLRVVGLVAVGAAAVLLVVSGRIGMLIWLAPLALPLLMRWRTAAGRARAAAGPSPGQTSGVETPLLRMWLDHDSGSMDGDVRTGPYAGRRLSDLSPAELTALLKQAESDPQSLSLLEAYLDRTYPEWRDADGGGGAAGASADGKDRGADGGMSPEEAYEILGLQPGADAEAVKEAHRRLMQRNHPDHGGSTYIAAQLNQAKDILLGKGHRTR